MGSKYALLLFYLFIFKHLVYNFNKTILSNQTMADYYYRYTCFRKNHQQGWNCFYLEQSHSSVRPCWSQATCICITWRCQWHMDMVDIWQTTITVSFFTSDPFWKLCFIKFRPLFSCLGYTHSFTWGSMLTPLVIEWHGEASNSPC
jgi:hypothetical protein